MNVRIRAGALVIRDGAVLLVEFRNDHDDGVHYNLPAGGMEPGESLVDTARREAREETCAEVEVGPVAFLYEYEPVRNGFLYGERGSLGVTFACRLKEGSPEPRMPERPDTLQLGVKWMPLSELKNVQLYPEIADDILAYAAGTGLHRSYVEEQTIQAAKQRVGPFKC